MGYDFMAMIMISLETTTVSYLVVLHCTSVDVITCFFNKTNLFCLTKDNYKYWFITNLT